MDENTIRLLLKEQHDTAERLVQQQAAAFQAQIEALRAELQVATGCSKLGMGAEEYFSLLNIPADQRLRIVGFNLEGAAAKWFRWMTRNRLIVDWPRFEESVKNRFCPSKYEDPQGALFKLLQTGTVAEYQGEFEKFMNRVTDISEALLISFYISGLKLSLQRELLVSKPTTLGDAFALARVIEVRLEDQNTVSVAPKVVNTSGGSQYQRATPSVKTPLLPTPPKATVASTGKPLGIKWISPAERQERLSKGLCFNCDNRWTRGHKCPGKFLLLMTDYDDDPGEEVTTNEDEAVESGDISILNSLVGHGSSRSLQLWGKIGTIGVHVLIDNGSTHNFVRPDVVERMCPSLEPTKAFKVYIGSVESLLCENVCSGVTLHMQGLKIEVDLYVLPMQGPDVVLGIQWLKKLGKVTHDYAQQIMEFTISDTTYMLKGDAALRMTKISLHRMQALLDMGDVYGIYECHGYALRAKSEHTTSTVVTSSEQPEIDQLLAQFGDLFEEPTCLPPRRLVDHRIHLLPNTKPVNVRPYRYPHYQKGEMEKLVNEMLSQGIIRFSHSPFSSPVLLAKKKDGSYRFCVDYCALNSVTVKDKFPIPTTDEMFDELGKARIFTKLDLRAGYHKIRVHEWDVYKTAFRTHDGHYEFLVMPFGLTNAPSTFQRSKFVFGAGELKYLRHIISARGVQMDPKKVSVVREWPVPRTQSQVRGFLGLAGYYRRFIRRYASVAAPLTDLLKHEGFKWGETKARAFEALKQQLSNAPLLHLPNFDQVFVVEADASGDGIRAVLMQGSRPISYFNRKLGPRMRVAATYQKELFAIMEPKYVRKLMGFDFDIEYKPGVANQAANALSRVFEEVEQVTATFLALSQPLVGFIGDLQGENETLAELLELHQKMDNGELLSGFRRDNGLILYNNRYYIGQESKFKTLLLQEFHATPSAGHGGVKKTLVGLLALFFWKGMRKSVKEFIKQCVVCQKTKYSTDAPGGYLQPLPTPSAVWEDVLMDFITGLQASRGITVILVVVDRLTKYAHFGTLPTSFNAHKVAEVFLEIVVKHHGIPRTIVSDRDPIFVSTFWKQLFHFSGTQLSHSTAYHPQTDGQTEVVNRRLEQYLRAMVSNRPQQWARHLPWAEYCYNSNYHTSIKMSPFQTLYGRLPLMVFSYPPGSSKVAAVDDLLVERDGLLRQLKDSLFSAKQQMEVQANRKSRDVEFNVGDMVLVKLQPYRQITLAKRLLHKLAKCYYGPYKVEERVGKVAYRLVLHVTSKIHLVFHVSILKAFVGNGAEVVTKFPEEFQDGPPVEQPLAVCGNRMVLRNGSPVKQILVRWAGGSPEEATWEWLPEFQTAYPAYNLEDKVIFEDGGNDSPLEDQPLEDHDVRTSKRVSIAPVWHKDFVVG
ncbi:ty3-gypsy retrotransposon protein [Tanacetum coccineum]